MPEINGQVVSGSKDGIMDIKDNNAEDLSTKNKFNTKDEPPRC
jgi:hypothetical protein